MPQKEQITPEIGKGPWNKHIHEKGCYTGYVTIIAPKNQYFIIEMIGHKVTLFRNCAITYKNLGAHILTTKNGYDERTDNKA